MAPGRLPSASKAALAALTIAAALLAGAGTAARPQAGVPEPAIDLATLAEGLEDGDLIFRRGRDLMSSIVLAQRGSRYSHVGIVVMEGPTPFVVHAMPADGGNMPSGVVREPLGVFAAGDVAAEVGVLRADRPAARRAQVALYAQRQIGKPFDASFAMSSDDSLYCTELALKAIEAAAGGGIVAPKTIDVPMIEEPVVTPDALAAHPALTRRR